LETLDADDATAARRDADEQLAASGLQDTGWQLAYQLAARPHQREPVT
jgi:hypothetical protein